MSILIYGAGVIGGKYMENEEYKKLSINEFTKAAERFEIRKGLRMHCVVRNAVEGGR